VLSGLWKRRWLSGVDSMEVSASVAVERIEDLLVKEKAAILERESDKSDKSVLVENLIFISWVFWKQNWKL
jgi:hypothetical protein